MRRSAAWVLVAAVWVSSAWGMGGDMGVGTEPLTDGSEAYPWLIEDFDDFGVFTNTANAAIYWAAGVHTRLMSNLDLDPALPGRQTYVTALIAPNGYEYAGSFDGDGHVISNLTLDDGDIGSSYMALFGRLTPGSEIHHLGLENLYSSGDGGLFYYSGTWIPPVGGGGCTISNCFVTGHVYFGGLFGMICYSSDIINCYAIGTVDSASGTYTGGLVGHFHEGNLINTYSAVDGHGMAGSNFYGRVINCYFDRDLAGSETSAGGWGKTTAQMKNAATFMGWKDGSWIINEGNDYPRLSWQGGGTPIATDYPARTYPGDGEAMPFELDSPEDIECLMYRTPDWDKRFILTADIDMAGVSHYRSIPKFAGEFDGGGHVISNLSIQASETGCNTDLGMFGLIYDGGVVKNLGLENCEINGVWYCGAMAGVNHGGTISNCFAAGTVSEGGSFIGGLIGSNNGHVSKSYANVNILGSLIAIHPDRFGGFVGENWYGEIYDCYALGDVDNIAQESGGFVGYNAYGTIQRCYSVGQGNRGFCYSSYSGSISDCFWDMDTSGSSSSTGGTGLTTAEMQSLTPYMGAGWNFEGTWVLFEGYNRYPELAWQLPGEMVAPYGVDVLDLATFSENWLTASAYGDWSPPGEDGFVDMRDFAEFAKNWLYTKPPVYQLYSGGAGTTEDPYLISDVHQLNKIGRITNHWSKHFRLIADIDMLTYTGTRYNIIGNSSTKFTGSFDGDGHVIYNLTHINWLNYIGLFGYTGYNAVITDLGLENVSIESDSYVGGLVGRCENSTITNCYVTGSVSGGNNYIGGLVGRLQEGTIENCYAICDVPDGNENLGGLIGYCDHGTIANCHAGGDVTSRNRYVGGLIGYCNYGTISNCYATGSVSGDRYIGGLCGQSYNNNIAITNCYAIGAVSGSAYTGGLCGYNNSSILASFWDVQTSGTTDGVGNVDPDPTGVFGKTTAEMQTLSTFTDAGWDFDRTWLLFEGYGRYPELVWQHPGEMVGPYGVDVLDLAAFSELWLSTTTGAGDWAPEGGDGFVDLLDLAVMAANWLEG